MRNHTPIPNPLHGFGLRRLLALLLCLPYACVGLGGESLHYLGQQVLPHGYAYAGTMVGGLSGIDYDPESHLFHAISDDRSRHGPARFYSLRLDLARFNAEAEPGYDGVHFTSVTLLKNQKGAPYPAKRTDPEAIRLAPVPGRLLWASEGDAARRYAPAITEIGLDGAFLRNLAVPPHFLPAGKYGVRNNLAFESLAVEAESGRVYAGVENALAQDGPKADGQQGSPSRIIVFDWKTGQSLVEHVYPVDPVPVAPLLPGLHQTNGLVELLSLGDGKLLALERAYAMGRGNSIRLYRIDLAQASDVADLDMLVGADYRPVSKRLLLDLGSLGFPVGNIEGMSWGPRQPNGKRTLILVSDDNFSVGQYTRFLAFEWDDGQ